MQITAGGVLHKQVFYPAFDERRSCAYFAELVHFCRMKGKQPPLSPRKYIETKARSLPLYKCWVNPEWKSAGLADVVVSRRHVNGHLTAAVYLVDLKCLGVKDTFYLFNEPEEDVSDKFRLGEGYFIEIEYNLAHNIIYAGHDFAEEYDIHPHKEFSTTKFLLEDDTEDVPLIDVPVGDKEGKPLLIVSPGYNYKPVLDKLKKNAGEGNFHYIIGIGGDDLAEEGDEEFDDDDDNPLDGIEPDFLDFQQVRDAYDEELEEALEEGSRSASDERIIRIEQRLRTLDESEPGWCPDGEIAKETPEYTAYEATTPLHQEEYKRSLKGNLDGLMKDVNEANERVKQDVSQAKEAIAVFEKYAPEEMPGFSALNSLPLITVTLALDDLRNKRMEYPPLVQVTIAGFSLALQKGAVGESYAYLTGAASVEEAFPAGTKLHALHHKIFWAVKSLHAMNGNNKEDVKHYHSLLALTGIGGRLKGAYAVRLEEWLAERAEGAEK